MVWEASALSWVVCGHGPSGRELVTSDDPSSVEVDLGAAASRQTIATMRPGTQGVGPIPRLFLFPAKKAGGGLH